MPCWAYSHNNHVLSVCLVISFAATTAGLVDLSGKGTVMLRCDSEIENSIRRVGSGAYVNAQQVFRLMASGKLLGPKLQSDFF